MRKHISLLWCIFLIGCGATNWDINSAPPGATHQDAYKAHHACQRSAMVGYSAGNPYIPSEDRSRFGVSGGAQGFARGYSVVPKPLSRVDDGLYISCMNASGYTVSAK